MTQVDEAKAKFLIEKTKAMKERTRQEALRGDALELELEAKQEKRDEARLEDKHFHVYAFDDSVNSGTVAKAINQFNKWVRAKDGCTIELQINSPGGEITSGFALFDHISRLRSEGHTVNTLGLGMVASMAGVLLQAGDKRVLGENAMFLIHEGSLGAIGDFGEVEDRVKLMKQMHNRILDIFERRAKPVNPKTTAKWIASRWQRTDWWLRADEAAKYGFCDEVQGAP